MRRGSAKINPYQFLQVSMNLAAEACKIIKGSYMNKNIKKYLKGDDDPVTEIDFKIQSMLFRSLKVSYPDLRLVGEEEKEYEGTVESITEKLQLSQFLSKIKFLEQYETNQSCLWVDPIDNTKGFIEGDIKAVTTLIGMSYKSKAQLGIIALPFKQAKERIYYNPSLIIGSALSGFAYEYFLLDKRWVQLNNKSFNNKIRVVMSPFRDNFVENKIADGLKAQKLLAGGAGYKMAMVAKKQAELMAYCLSGTQKWDTCAGQAIVRGMKGHCTSQYGEEILYNPQKPKQFNQNGLICSLSKQLLNTGIKISSEQRKQRDTKTQSTN